MKRIWRRSARKTRSSKPPSKPWKPPSPCRRRRPRCLTSARRARPSSLWMAGGGINGGITYGATDDFGYKAVEKPMHVHDLHATILYLLGIDHLKLIYPYSGRDFRLTDTAGEVIHDIVA